MSFTETIIAFAGDRPILVGLLIALSALLEAVPFVGSLFPGSTAVMLLSGAIGAAGGPIWPLVVWGCGGGFIGDVLSYWLGRRYGLSLREFWPFATRPALWEHVAEYFQRHGGKSVVFSRFLPGARAVTPIAAGALGMRLPFFLFTSVVAALAWAMVYVIPAAFLGQLLSTAGQISPRLVGAVLTVVVALALTIWLARFAAAVAGPRIYRIYRNLIERMEHSSNSVARRIGGLLDPAFATIGAHLLWGTILLISAIGLFGIISGIVASTELIDIDGAIRTFARSLRSSPVDIFMVTVTAFGEGWVIAISVILLITALLIGHAFLTAAIVASVFAATYIFVPAINALLRLEYTVSDIHPISLVASFPSSHVALVTLFCCVVAALATPALGIMGRMVAWSLAVAIATLVGLSRIYLDTLWPSDVAGGLLLGLALTAVFAMIRTGFELELGKSLRYPLIALAVFLAVGGTRAALYHDVDLARYAPRAQTIQISEARWLTDDWQRVPLHRFDFLDHAAETISLQVAADLPELAAVLAKSGWRPAPRFKWRDLFLFLSPAAPIGMLPPLPLMEGGRIPVQTFLHPGAVKGERLVMRLWETDFSIGFPTSERALLIGSITGEKVIRPYDALTMLDTRPSGRAFDDLLRNLIRNSGTHLRVVRRRGPVGPVLLVAPRIGDDVVGTVSQGSGAARLENRAEHITRQTNGNSPALR